MGTCTDVHLLTHTIVKKIRKNVGKDVQKSVIHDCSIQIKSTKMQKFMNQI